MYDYYLGGRRNYEIDRRAADAVRRMFPHVRLAARTNRDFMHRATRFLSRAGVRQFLDVGSGIPTEPNLHQVALEIAPDARVVYVDHDPIVLALSKSLLAGAPTGAAGYLHADLTAPHTILESNCVRRTLDLTQPVALSLVSVMHFIPGSRRAHDLVATLLAGLVPGSYLVMSHNTGDFDPLATYAAMRVYHSRGMPLQLRSRTEFADFFAGLDLVEPGIVVPHRWRPEGRSAGLTDAQVSYYAAVARKP